MIRIFILFSLSDVEKLLSQSGKIYLSGESITFTVVKMHHPTCNNPAPSLTKTEVLVSTNSTNSLDFTVYSWAKTQILNYLETILNFFFLEVATVLSNIFIFNRGIFRNLSRGA